MGNASSLRRAIEDERWADVRRILGSPAAQTRVQTKWYTVGPRGNKQRVTALHLLCLQRAPQDIVDCMLRISPNSITKRSIPGGYLPLHYAVKKPRRTKLFLVGAIANAYPPAVAARASQGGAQTPLHLACSAAAPVAWIQMLHDANPGARDVLDGHGCTPWETTKASTGWWRFFYRRAARKILKHTTVMGSGLEEDPGVADTATAATGTDAVAAAAAAAATTVGGEYGESEPLQNNFPEYESGSTENGLCVVCWDQCANYAVIPCGHLCLCADCSTTNVRHLNGKCPLCTRRIDRTVRIYQAGIQTPAVSPSAPLEFSDY